MKKEAIEIRPIHKIASEIRRTWKTINYGAKPYLDAMNSLEDKNSTYGCDSAKSIVIYFLSNASGWRGDDAKRIKNELKELVK